MTMKNDTNNNNAALDNLTKIQRSSNPTCPFMTDKEVYKRGDGPHNQGANWMKEEKQKTLADDPEIAAALLYNDNVPKYTLKNKLRDHVGDLFGGMSKVDNRGMGNSVAKDSYSFDDSYKKEISNVADGNRRQANIDSKWAEQVAVAKRMGMYDKS